MMSDTQANGATKEELALKAEQDKAAAARAAQEDKARAIREAFSKRVTDGAEGIAEAFKNADKQESAGGFFDLLKASEKIALDWNGFAVWTPARAKQEPTDMELRVRETHNWAHPPTSPAFRANLGRYLRRAVYASRPD